MPNPSATAPAQLPETWAEVRNRDQVMRYRRSGVGPSIVLLQPARAAETLWAELTESLSAGFRVIAPELPASENDIARWLSDFLEGLGLAGVPIVAADTFCIAALELALLGAEQVTRVVLVPDGSAEETGLNGTLVTSMRNSSVALLVVRRALAAEEAVPLVMTFLGRDEARSAG